MKRDIYIFGAHSRARTLREYLEHVHKDLHVRAFLVNNEESNPEEADGVPVFHITGDSDTVHLDRTCPVYLGMRSVNHPAVITFLEGLGFAEIIPLTVELDTALRNAYLEKTMAARGEAFLKLEAYETACTASGETVKQEISAKQLRLYVASSIYDGKLQERHEMKAYEQVLQVGCALTDQRMELAVYDDQGVSISGQNQQFCELTALYWIWQNAKEDYVGLEHYRRFFVLPDNMADIMDKNRIDVVLPVPLFVAPSVEENYKSRHVAKVWEDMMQYLQERDPAEAADARKFFGHGLYSPCNMLIARKEVFDELCAWMFPILFAVTELNGRMEDRYQNRYPGFLSERLISFYFWRRRESLKRVYADKVFLQ